MTRWRVVKRLGVWIAYDPESLSQSAGMRSCEDAVDYATRASMGLIGGDG